MLAVVRRLVLYIPTLIAMNHLLGMCGLVWTQFLSDFVMIDSHLDYLLEQEFDKGHYSVLHS